MKALKELLNRDAPIRLSGHIRKRMKERNFDFADIRNVLRLGKILLEGEMQNGSFRYRVETNKMFIVFAFDEDCDAITLVTGQWLTKGRQL